MIIKLEKKFDNDPDFILGRFSIILAIDQAGTPLFKIGDFRVMMSQAGGRYLKIGIWDQKTAKEKTNVFVKKVMQDKLLELWDAELVKQGVQIEEPAPKQETNEGQW